MIKYAFLLTFILATGYLQGQYFEVGLLAGATNYRGDLSENSARVFLKESHFSGGLFARYNVHHLGAFRLALQYGQLSGTDANAGPASIRQRNLSFSTTMVELALTGEFNILGYQPYNFERPFSPYLFGGIAFNWFTPSAEYQGEKVKLRDLGTEGQGMAGRPAPYAKSALALPFGLGFKYAVTDALNLGLEFGARIALTDYLDDVSTTYVANDELLAGNGALAAALGNRTGEFLGTEPVSFPTGTPRGDSQNRDWYFLAGFSISYNFIDNGLVGSRSRTRGRKSGCRTN